MTNANINNPQAFPMHIEGLGFETGMTLRDYFAAKALIGLLSGRGHEPVEDFNHWTEQISEASYKYADSMLKERMKPHDQHEER